MVTLKAINPVLKNYDQSFFDKEVWDHFWPFVIDNCLSYEDFIVQDISSHNPHATKLRDTFDSKSSYLIGVKLVALVNSEPFKTLVKKLSDISDFGFDQTCHMCDGSGIQNPEYSQEYKRLLTYDQYKEKNRILGYCSNCNSNGTLPIPEILQPMRPSILIDFAIFCIKSGGFTIHE